MKPMHVRDGRAKKIGAGSKYVDGVCCGVVSLRKNPRRPLARDVQIVPSDVNDPMYKDNLWRIAQYNGVEVVLLNVSEVE